MKKLLQLLLPIAVLLSGCAGVGVTPDQPVDSSVAFKNFSTMQQQIKDNPVFKAGMKDAQRTLSEDIEPWVAQGLISPVDEMAARACPEMTLKAIPAIQEVVDENTAFIKQLDQELMGIGAGQLKGPIQLSTEWKWGPKTAKADIKTLLNNNRDKLLNIFRSWQRACTNNINDVFFRDMLEAVGGSFFPMPKF